MASDGGIFSFGDASSSARRAGTPPSDPVVGMAATPSGPGYWVVSAAGAVKAFGEAVAAGGLDSRPAVPVVGTAATPSGKGYWLMAADGKVFAFGDAVDHGPA